MTRHRLAVADVFREYGSQFLDQYGDSLSIDQKRAFRAILACQTPALGGHLYQCDDCAHQLVLYNSCRNRHCPKCQAMERANWVEARTAELLPIPYFHVVMTLPHDIGPIALQNKRVIYGIFMRAAAETIKELAADSKHLGAEIGILAVLHTWGQKLDHHAHVHCICTGGGISPDGTRWVPCKRSKKSEKEFFIHHKVLALKFRGKFIAFLKRAYHKGELSFHGKLSPLKDAGDGVHPTFSPARATLWLHAHSALRIPCQSFSQGQVCPVSRTAGRVHQPRRGQWYGQRSGRSPDWT